ncbi:MAG: hypothetical protein U0N15_03505 [Bifidobacterium choerinum]
MSGVEEITNLCATPYGTRKTIYSWNMDARQEPSGKWSYMTRTGSQPNGTFAFQMGYNTKTVGDVLVCVFSCDRPDLMIVPRGTSQPRISGTETTEGAAVSERMGWVAGRLAATSGAHELWVPQEAGWLTLEGCAVFSVDDWPQVRKLLDAGDLPMAWFAPPRDAASGETRPPVLVP